MLACARVRPAFVLARLHSSSLQLCTRGGSRLQQSEVAQFCSNLSCIDVSCYMSATRKLNASAILRVKLKVPAVSAERLIDGECYVIELLLISAEIIAPATLKVQSP